ncbi:putative transposase [Candidatus Nitrososphaera gargensis Ga9.2]|uniref:Putative transposase n=1 Tax=Nitrososphaera gargensis (strain Ga9.2) TaxID=1237085 RepID=K0I9G0_NITGG|nr:putative transposase [Candidatus Nitrososphaera gargensis Ga9.2]
MPISKTNISICKPSRITVGIDVGITKFCHDSDNNSIDNPLFLNNDLRPLRRAGRVLSRRLKGSNNWKKAKIRLQILHEHIMNKHNNFLYKLSTEYSKRYDVIFLERLHALNNGEKLPSCKVYS